MVHYDVIAEGGIGGVLTFLFCAAVNRLCGALRRDSESTTLRRMLEESRKERKECQEERGRDRDRIDTLDAKVDGLKADIEKQAHDFQVELRAANETARLAMVSAQANDDGRRAAEAKLAEVLTQLRAANDYAIRLRAEIHVLDPEHPEAVAPTPHAH